MTQPTISCYDIRRYLTWGNTVCTEIKGYPNPEAIDYFLREGNEKKVFAPLPLGILPEGCEMVYSEGSDKSYEIASYNLRFPKNDLVKIEATFKFPAGTVLRVKNQ